MRVLITGGAGFIGSNLTRYLMSNHNIDSLTVIDDLSTGDRRNLEALDVDFIEASINDQAALSRAARRADSIVHLAALPSVPRSILDPVGSNTANVTGTLNVLEAARKGEVEHVIVASSSSVYGSNPALPKSEFDWTRPMSPYAVTKLASEGYAIAYSYSYGLKTLAFRFFNVYGPGQSADHAYAAVIPKFVDAALNGRPVEIHGDGQQSRDFTYVETVCAVISRAIERKVHAVDPVNLAYGTNTTLHELLDEIELRLGMQVGRRYVSARVGDVRRSQADNSVIRKTFPEIDPTSLEKGLATTIEWFKSARRNP